MNEYLFQKHDDSDSQGPLPKKWSLILHMVSVPVCPYVHPENKTNFNAKGGP